jgi:Protein of unknown function (DUF3313)
MNAPSNRNARWLALAVFIALAAGCASTGTSTPTRPPVDADGLTARSVGGLDEVLVRPGVDFRVYKTVLIEPLEIAFDRDWDPNRVQPDSSRRLSPADIEKIKAEMAREFRSVFVEELTSAGYRVVEQAAADTLRIKPALADVYINAPEKIAAGISRTYTKEAGEMTLQLEAHDGRTGQLLARVVDRKQDTGPQELELTNSVTNRADFRRGVRDWAKRLSTALDIVSFRVG